MTRTLLAFGLALLLAGVLVLGLPRVRSQAPMLSLPQVPQGLAKETSMMRHPAGLMGIVGLSLLLVLGVTGIQEAAQLRRIGVLSGGPKSFERLHREAALRQGLLDLGYIEGQNIAIEYRYGEGQFSRLSALARELVELKVEALVVTGSESVRAAQGETTTIPIVMTHVGDPEDRGFVTSLAHPDKNITGLSNVSDLLAGKLLELLIEAVPGLSSVAVLWNRPQPAHTPQLAVIKEMASGRGIAFHPVEVNHPEEMEKGLDEVRDKKPGALIVLGSAIHFLHLRRIADFALAERLPAISWERPFAENGLLIAYGASEKRIFQRAAYYVDRLLKGTKVADLPVEQPTAFELIINLRTAQAFGLSLSASLLLLAKDVIR
jgi:putative ABC transport system substrate-binding protein